MDSDYQDEINALEDEIYGLEEGYYEVRKELLEMKEQIAQLQAERDELKHDIERALNANTQLLAEIEALRGVSEEAADELEGYVLNQYPLDQHHFPSMKRGYDAGMSVVNRIRALLGSEGKGNG